MRQAAGVDRDKIASAVQGTRQRKSQKRVHLTGTGCCWLQRAGLADCEADRFFAGGAD